MQHGCSDDALELALITFVARIMRPRVLKGWLGMPAKVFNRIGYFLCGISLDRNAWTIRPNAGKELKVMLW